MSTVMIIDEAFLIYVYGVGWGGHRAGGSRPRIRLSLVSSHVEMFRDRLLLLFFLLP